MGGKWFYITAPDLGDEAIEMHISVWPLLEFASNGGDEVIMRMLRKNTLEVVKISLGRSIYMKGGALYYVLDYTGAQYGAKETGRKKLWIGNATRKVIKNYPEVINLSW